MKMVLARLGLLLSALMILAVAGCTGGSSNSAGSRAMKADRAPAGKAAPSAKPAVTTTSLQQRDIVRTATVKLRTKHVDRAADAIVALAEPAGGRVDKDDRSTRREARTATLVLRIPPNALDRIISRIDALGTETGRSVHGQDVTASKADITARTAALRTSVTRLRGLLSHSGNINQLVLLEGQLSQRESELESMQAQQRALADKVSLATLTVELSAPKPVPAEPKTRSAGIGDTFVSGWHALVTTVRGVIKVIGYSSPITAVIALIGGVCALLWRRHRRRTPAEPAP